MTDVPPIGLSKRGGRYNGQFRPEFSRLYEDPDLFSVTPLPVRYMLAVVGPRWSGKSEAMAILHEELGFDVHSLVDIVRATAEAQGRDVGNRRVRQQLADTLRIEHADPEGDGGDGAYLARRLLRRIHDRHVRHGRHLDPPCRIALSGFGHPDELKVFCHIPKFRIVRLDCKVADRRSRAYDSGSAVRDADALGLSYRGRRQAFKAVDRCDLRGVELSPWAADCAHSTEAVLAFVDELGPRGTVFRLDTGHGRAKARGRLEKIVETLDQEYRQP